MADGALAGKVALVTGASRGIGYGIARRFAAEGAAVAVTARTLEPEPDARLGGSLRETVAEIEDAGGRALPVQADLNDADSRATIVPEVEAALGPIDVLVNNAAAATYLPNAEISLKRRRLTFEINVEAPIDLTQAVLPGMRERGSGWILNISSATSKHPQGPPFDPGVKLGLTSTISRSWSSRRWSKRSCGRIGRRTCSTRSGLISESASRPSRCWVEISTRSTSTGRWCPCSSAS